MIRRANREDLPACAALIRRSFRTVAEEFGFTPENAPRFTAFAVTGDRLARQMDGEGRLMFLDEEDGVIRGFYSLLIKGGECELGNLCAAPELRRQGLGGRLLEHAVRTAKERGCAVLKLSIVDENLALRRWYERHGAVYTGSVRYDFFPFTCGSMEIPLGEDGQARAEALAGAFAEGARKILGDGLTGVYLHGSAAMGCYEPAKSDVDLIAVTETAPDDKQKRAFLDMTAALHKTAAGGRAGHGGIEMSVVRRAVCRPFVYPTPFETHFSAMHADAYERDPDGYVQRMKGTDRDLAAHFTVILKRGRCLCGLPIKEVFGEVPAEAYLDSIRNDVAGAKEEIAENPAYFTLNLVRVLAYQTEGTVLSKREGGEWGLTRLPERFRPLIRAALADYGGKEGIRYEPELLREYAAYMLGLIFHEG